MAGKQDQNVIGRSVAEQLQNDITRLIQSNHHEHPEMVMTNQEWTSCYLKGDVDWTIFPWYVTSRFVGNAARNTHFGYNRQAYDAYTAQRGEMGRSYTTFHENFETKILDTNGSQFGNSSSTQQIGDMGEHSVHCTCNTCSGSGALRCNSCNGSGSEFCCLDHNCLSCHGHGSIDCGRCHGSGKQRCNSCDGHGYFTDVTHVTVRAEPHITYTARSKWLYNELLNYLCAESASKLAPYLGLELKEHRRIGDAWQVTYEVNTMIAKIDIARGTKKYVSAGIGKKGMAFIRPPIFDDVFVAELADLKDNSPDSGVSLRRARRLFRTYVRQPALDAAVKAIARPAVDDNAPPGKRVKESCEGFISIEASNLLGTSMAAMLDKVSPKHSFATWLAVMSMPLLLVLLVTQNWYEHNESANYLAMVLWACGLLLGSALLGLMLAPLAVGTSKLVCTLQQKILSAEYRQQQHNWKPLKRFILAFVVIATLGAVEGSLAHRGILPRLANGPKDWIDAELGLNQYTSYVRTSKWLQQVGLFVPDKDQAKQSQYALILDIQKGLNRVGYKLVLNGQLNVATQHAIKSYASKHKINASDLSAVNDSLSKKT